jgi:hypothetical protein
LLNVTRGTCHVLFAYDIAFSIDLDAVERRITAVKQRETIKHKRRAPEYFQYQPAPVRVTQMTGALLAGQAQTNPNVDLVLYDFGAVSVLYSIPLAGPMQKLLDLSGDLYENPKLLEDSRKRVQQLLELVQDAVSKPNITTFVEDYIIFHVESFDRPCTVEELVTSDAQLLAQILRAETKDLSKDELTDAASHRISFSSSDIAIIDWNAAIIFDQDADDTLAVLEFANVELLEMRYLDRRLDDALGLAYETLSKRTWKRFPFGSDPAELERVAQWQVDSAILFEGVNNSLKLLGDQYLARVYRIAAERLHLNEWDASIIRKLDTLESIYGKISDQVASRRMEMLEWIIIVLIAVSIVLPFL